MQYADLDEAAQERAREWWKNLESECWGSDRAPELYEDMATSLSYLGIEVHQESVKHVRGDRVWHTTEYGFEWSGFWSQGDGLAFKGKWRAEDVDLAKLLEERGEGDEKLIALCTEMMALKLKWPIATATITTVSNGPGLPYISIEDYYTENRDQFGDPESIPDEDVKVLRELVKRACDYCYRTLESNYEYDTGDEAAKEAIEANEYEFNEDGSLGVGAHA